MGCDIHLVAQRRGEDGKWITVEGDFGGEYHNKFPFDWRSYRMFGFLAGVRDSSAVLTISEPRGVPHDFNIDREEEEGRWIGEHSFSWLSIEELLAVDYSQPIDDEGDDEEASMPLSEFLGECFLSDLHKAKELGIERIVFGFDN